MDDRPTDERSAIYRDLHEQQLESEEACNRHSARAILGMLLEEFAFKSMLDVGCGLGAWLSVAREMGVREVCGMDGAWLDKKRLRVPENLVRICDLEKPFNLGRRFDLVACLEVAEHLDAGVARSFVSSLCLHGDILLFSAAIPFQGGHFHVNEQWPQYWKSLFQEQGFQLVDFIRKRLWNDGSILLWLRQNILLFVHERAMRNYENLRKLSRCALPLPVVHPDLYMAKLKSVQALLEERNKIIALLADGGSFNVQKGPNGQITIVRSS